TIDEMRSRMPQLRAREAGLRAQLEAAQAQAADRDAYLKLAGDLEGFLAQLRGTTATASTGERRRVLKLLVKDVLIGPEKITIRHRIPARASATGVTHRDPRPDTEGDHRAGCQVRWGRDLTRARESVPALRVRQLDGAGVSRRRLRTLRGRRGRALRQPGSGTSSAGGPAGADAWGRPGTAPGQDQGRVLQGQQPAWLLRAHRVHLPGVRVPGPGGTSQDR